MVTTLHIKSSELIYLKLKPCTLSPKSPQIPNHWQPCFYSLFLSLGFSCFFFEIPHVMIHIICIFCHMTFFSINIISSRFVLVVTKGKISFLFLRINDIPLYIFSRFFFIHQTTFRLLHILAIVNNHVINIRMQIALQNYGY